MNKVIEADEQKKMYLLAVIGALMDCSSDNKEIPLLFLQLVNKSEIITRLDSELREVYFTDGEENDKSRQVMDQIKNAQGSFFDNLGYIEEVLTSVPKRNRELDNMLEQVVFPLERDENIWRRDLADVYNDFLRYFIKEFLYTILTSDSIDKIEYMNIIEHSNLAEKMQYLEKVLLPKLVKLQNNRSCWYIYEYMNTGNAELKYLTEYEYTNLINSFDTEMIKKDFYKIIDQSVIKKVERVIYSGRGRISNFDSANIENVFSEGYYEKLDRTKTITAELMDPILALSNIYEKGYYSISPDDFLQLVRVINGKKKAGQGNSEVCIICGKKREPYRSANGMRICCDHFTVME